MIVVIEPGDTSMLLQAADAGVNRLIKEQYAKEYTETVCSSNVAGRVFDDVERIACIACALYALEENPTTILRWFERPAQ